jgi:hypothetical protein
MRITGGNGGWFRTDSDEFPGPLYVRVQDVDGRMQATELYVDGRGEPLSRRSLRSLNLAPIEAWATEVASTPAGAARMQAAGPDLSRLASHFATGFGSQARHWVADSLRAQYDDSDVPQAPMARERRSGEEEQPLRLSPPEDGRLTDDFLRQVADAYHRAIQRQIPPAAALADQAGVSPRTVHRWVYTARKRGILPATRRGRIV